MSRKKPEDQTASIRQRLLNLARAHKEDFLITLIRFGVERLMYRLSKSKYTENFILKGATLYLVWSEKMYRPTRDLDLLAINESSVEKIVDIFRDVCAVKVKDDGLEFQDDTARGIEIREEQEHNGVRVTLEAKLGEARIPLQIDIGFGDVIIPAPKKIDFPSMLDLPSPRINAYPPEAVVAEKFQAMVMLGIKNSRMKDFYEV
jgi:predicted nucleotidyltransferase component of viral defense system